MSMPLVLTCEHATCAVPEAFRELFQGAEEILTSPRGWDPGALNLAQHLSREFRTPLLHGEITRLLVELNGAPDNPQLFSEFALRLPEGRREGLFKRNYQSYLETLRARLADCLTRHPRVLHLSVHTFPRELAGKRQAIDIGILFDPGREEETALVHAWSRALRAAAPALAIEASALDPASTQHLTTLLRGEHLADAYLGIGLEVCQSFFLDGAPLRWDAVRKLVTTTLKETIS
jgi:predicted N-formylglutamate amidohydrolase